jgi:thioredoxin reductase (NADPH)
LWRDHRREQLQAKSNIAVELHAEVAALHGETHLTALDVLDRPTGQVRRCDSGGLFVFIGATAQTDWLPPEIARAPSGYILTGADVVRAGRWHETRDPYLLESSVPGMFACGDVRLSPVKRVAAAVGEGSMAIALVHQHLQTG